MLGPGQIVFNPTSNNRKNHSPPSLNSGLPPKNLHQQVQEGKEEAIKENVKEATQNHDKFNKLVNYSKKNLFTAKSFFPIDLFPDYIAIERQQVHVVNREFFGSERRHSIHIQDLSDVFVDTTPFLATVKLVDKNYVENLIIIKNLKKDDALKARRIIQGLIVANRESIELSEFSDHDLVSKLEQLGGIDEAPHDVP